MADSHTSPVAILGCGPAGLFAAHAIATAGGQPFIISQKGKSRFPGAQYLQRPIPGLCGEPDGYIKTMLLGDKGNYAKRVYGDPEIATSWPAFADEPEAAWDLRLAYDKAWDLYVDRIADIEIMPGDVAELTATFELVISTVPGWALCLKPEEHKFDQMPIYHKNVSVVKYPQYDNYVVYNGSPLLWDWYRCAHIFGTESSEAVARRGNERDDHLQGWEPGYKILGNNCDCHPNLVRTGRLGAWRRGVLTYHAFEHATAAYLEQIAA